MESLGGNERFNDRFVAQHIAFFYYWIVVILYICSPAVAYDLNKHVERHAFSTYDQFLQSNEDELKSKAAPQVAVDYYEGGDLYMFDAFQYTNKYNRDSKLIDKRLSAEEKENNRRRPVVKNLYDGECQS